MASESSTKGGRTNDGPSSTAYLKPPGYSESAADADLARAVSRSPQDQVALKTKKSWELAISPVTQFAMNGFMLVWSVPMLVEAAVAVTPCPRPPRAQWMSGNQPNIFSIMITSYVMYNPVKAISSVNATFARLEDGKVPLALPKTLYVLLNMAVCAFGLLKMSWLGLLPTEPADWISFYRVRPNTEFSSGGMAL